MFRNYLKVAWRNILRDKVYSGINIGGLAIGMVVAGLIGLWIYDELTMNRQHANYDRLAQVMQHASMDGTIVTFSSLPMPTSAAIRDAYGEDFERVASTWVGERTVAYKEKVLLQTGCFAEAPFPGMITLDMLRGTTTGLSDPSAIFLSESLATSLFGAADPIGQTVQLDYANAQQVKGIYKDLPANSSFSGLAFIAPIKLLFANGQNTDNWYSSSFHIFAQLTAKGDFKKSSEKIKNILYAHTNDATKPVLFLNPMSRWHLYEFRNGISVNGRMKFVWLFGIIGGFVLLLACINFMNLSTARSEKRAREVGIRKAIGSLRIQLISQFFSESILITTCSFLISLVFVIALLPFFNEVADKKITVPLDNPFFWLLGLGFSVLTGLIAGSYPAFYFSSFQPVKILKGTFKAGKWAAIPRKALVTVQFTVSVIMIIGTVIVFRQIQFVKNRPIGYESNGLVVLPMVTEDIHKHFDAVKAALLKTGTIVSIAESGSTPTEAWNTSSGFEWKGKDPALSVDFPRIDVSYDYGKTIGWELAAGRDFSKDFASDSSAFIINEAAVKFMGLQNPIGETIKWFGEPYKVVGVIKDMIMQNPYEQVKPAFFTLYTGAQNVVVLKINPAVSAGNALSAIEPVFRTFNPAQPFEYHFADEAYNRKFGNEERIGKLAGFFAALAIFISCLGLFGMASFMAEQRTKEIGIRKVLGASVLNVWRLLSKDFVALVILSLFIATPIAYYFMHSWLQGYEYRTPISWWFFAATGAGALLITLLTVSFQAIKAALANPTKSLKTE